MNWKIGSLFDGSGGFPLAASLCGIEPTWAAEVEPYPIAVTRSRFPNMKHLGSVTDINGGEIEPVDIITFGSPCQDLSVAGKRAGLKHEANGDEETTRSGLFMEAVRIIREMREATNGRYPTFALWENVPGAFSSNKGEDFRTVCEELIKIVEPGAVMPAVPQKGWPYADSYCGDGWSLSYRVFDAQYWGVPQRRRRIHLILDLRGERAGKVLFEREGLRGHSAESGTPWQATAGDAEGGIGADDLKGAVPYTLKIRSGCEGGGKGALIQTDLSATLATNNDQYLFQPVGVDVYNLKTTGDKAVSLTTASNATGSGPTVAIPTAYSFDSLASNSMKSSNPYSGCRQVEVSKCLDTTDPNPSKNQGGIAIVESVPYTLEPGIAAREGGHIYEGVSGTLRANAGDNQMAVAYPVPNILLDDQGGQQINVRTDDKCPTLRAEAHGNVPAVMAYSIENHPADSRVSIDESGKVQTLTSRMGTGGGNVPMVMEPIPIHDQATRFSGKRGDKEDGKGNGLGIGEPGDPMNTLTSGDRHAVAYQKTVGALCARDYKGVGSQYVGEDKLVIQPTVRYIVRRLTPTECARLQGFPDAWGHPDSKDSFTDEEYRFWLEVRNTHAAINGKAVKEYTKEQMLKWYNSLHTDSAEYKMWGNGIALPPALYCMQGMADALWLEEDECLL